MPNTEAPILPDAGLDSSKKQLRVISVSLGSSSRDHSVQAELLGQSFSIERRGTDGDLVKARQTIAELDGKVAAIGLGGIDMYVVAGGKRYVMRDAARLARAAKTTPVVDGSGLKDTLERSTIQRLQSEGIVDFRNTPVLLVSAVDRFGMAEELVNAGARCTFGDFLFILGMAKPLHDLKTVRQLGSIILPIATRLPFKMLYPTGAKQEAITSSPKYDSFYNPCEIIAGDFLLIRRFLPDRLDGKTILTNTVTTADIELLKSRGVKRLITTTPEFEGRSFGTNVMEGVFVALGATGSRGYTDLLERLAWKPRIIDFQ